MSKKDKEKKNIDGCEGERTQGENPLSPENSAVGDERLKRFPLLTVSRKTSLSEHTSSARTRPPVPWDLRSTVLHTLQL